MINKEAAFIKNTKLLTRCVLVNHIFENLGLGSIMYAPCCDTELLSLRCKKMNREL